MTKQNARLERIHSIMATLGAHADVRRDEELRQLVAELDGLLSE